MRVVGLLLLLGVGAARAQPAFERVGGLPHSTVAALLEDRRGFLWAGTADGLARYDGRAVEVFRRRAGVPGGPPSNTVQALLEAPDGALWVGTAAGACRLEDEGLGRFACPGPGLDVLALVWAEGTVWAVTVEGPWRLADGAFRPVPVGEGDDWQGVTYGARGGRLWGAGGAPGGRTVHHVRYDADRDRLVEVRRETLRDGEVALATPAGVRRARVPAASPEAFGVLGAGPAPVASARTAPAGAGALWVGSVHGLVRWDGAAAEAVALADGSPLSNAVLALEVDRAGAVWVGTRSGLFVHDPGRARFDHLDPAAHGAAAPVMAVATAADGALWVGTLGGGLLRRGPGGRVEARGGEGLDARVWALRADGAGGLWVGTDGGLCRRAPSGTTCLRGSLARGDGRAFVYVLEGDGAGGLWAAGSTLARLDADGRLLRTVALDGVGTPTALHRDARGRLWVGVEKRGLWRLDGGALRRVPLGGLGATSVWAVHEADGALWLGTSDGLARLDPASGAVEAHAVGLPGSTVYGVAPDGDALWLTTGRGLARYRPADGALRVFGPADGVGSVEFNRRALHRGLDGRLHAGGMAGLTSFDPAALAEAGPAPAAVVTRLSVDGRARSLLGGVRLGPAARALAFDVAAPLPAGGRALRYAYRMDPLDGEWIEIEGEPTVRLAGLPPGDYVFRARASRGDGEWGPEAALPVTLLPPWYRTAWARALVAVALSLGAVLAVQARIRAVRREERMRWRIASDLHDDVGSRLASVALLAEHVRDRAGLDGPEARQLTSVAEAARGMIASLREIVWFVDPAHDRPGAFAARAREAAASLVGPHAAVEAPDRGRIDAAPLAFRRDVFLVLKEALHNAARHAPGAAVTVRLEETRRAVVLEVADDGPGFVPAAAEGGTGLRSLRHRAEALGGTLGVRSAPGEGTVVTLRAPLP